MHQSNHQMPREVTTICILYLEKALQYFWDTYVVIPNETNKTQNEESTEVLRNPITFQYFGP